MLDLFGVLAGLVVTASGVVAGAAALNLVMLLIGRSLSGGSPEGPSEGLSRGSLLAPRNEGPEVLGP
jgi:hypothetical protein